MPYQVTIWCSDCYNEDFLGCFDGGSETIMTDPDTQQPILTQERAERIGWQITHDCGPWDYEVSEVLGENQNERSQS